MVLEKDFLQILEKQMENGQFLIDIEEELSMKEKDFKPMVITLFT
jgi:hypothetical protein